jgi:NADPH:quinone reductase-like Zn-dependent oxidoreductase
VNLGRLWDEQKLLRHSMEELLVLARSGQLRARVDRVFPLAQGQEAHRYLEERRNVGKVLLSCED